ncbi:unnamed protein product [Symbiodinium natans]|uniref:Fungal lipase-type domain-containing protein n=1 Tax=Symbiodinium natans TaxID=878477 RepID=A0A812KD34_9DINO|nr:unnamed protein product [Symbiodinium natans]
MSEIDDVSESDENHVVFAEEPVRLRSGQRRTSRKFSTKTEALLRRKREQWSATRRIFALWHSYLLLIAACAIACSVLVVILFWHVDWYERYRESGDIVEFQLHFLATFIKSWLLVNLSSEMLRFCYLLAVDSWRDDVFEAYRRALCFASFAEIAAGTFYVCGWPQPMGNWRRRADVVFQLTIYATLDILPIVTFAMNFASWRIHYALASLVLVLACLHVLLFLMAWTLSNAAMKFKAFRAAWKSNVVRVSRLGTATRILPIGRLTRDGTPASVLPDRVLESTVMAEEVDTDSDSSDEDSEEEEEEELPDRNHVLINEHLVRKAEQLAVMSGDTPIDVCVPLCMAYRALCNIFPLLLAMTATLFGLVASKPPVAVIGAIAVCMVLTLAHIGTPVIRPRWSQSFCESETRLRHLEEWGEVFCGLKYMSQLRARAPLCIMVFFMGVLAGSLNWWYSMWCCSFILLACFAAQLAVLFQKPWTWLIGLVETFLLVFLCLMVLWYNPLLNPWQDSALLGILLIPREFGLQKRLAAGERMRYLALFALGSFQFALICVISNCMAVERVSATESMFCLPGSPHCEYYPVDYRGALGGRWPICQMDFPIHGKAVLNLADFGMMSAFAYEPAQHVPYLLNEYFPGWRVAYAHLPLAVRGAHHDVTTFFEFTSADNSTAVFAVRGTTDFFDALQDMDLWLPVFMMYIFENLGPNVVKLWGPSIAWICRQVYMLQDARFTLTFIHLLQEVKARMKSHPDRNYYITGHSLGGGIAKLVAAEVQREEIQHAGRQVEMTAVAFAAPGIGVAEALLFGEDQLSTNRYTSVTVRPRHDIVSRIDHNTGATIPVGCRGNPRHCHSIYATLCAFYNKCGSLRPDVALKIPCGWCEHMPC